MRETLNRIAGFTDNLSEVLEEEAFEWKTLANLIREYVEWIENQSAKISEAQRAIEHVRCLNEIIEQFPHGREDTYSDIYENLIELQRLMLSKSVN